jgi:eukaryotic-like serine/threonine-protein kinase
MAARRPPPDETLAPVPRDTLQDPASRDTLAIGVSNQGGSMHPPSLSTLPPARLEEVTARYETRSILGSGGMGEVYLSLDRRIGREIAMKVMRAEAAQKKDVRERFEREARVQGQLEHPAIVPVYDLAAGPDGADYFTMKRVRGHTLEQILAGLREKDPTFVAAYPWRKLLTTVASACLAMAFAHARGVLHRDLKPGNIMLGDFGEVYVLDWGLAKMFEPLRTPGGVPPILAERTTARGSVMGTPGYMAPEQVQGADDLDGRTDIFGLGAILFEVLTLEPLFPVRPVMQMLSATLVGADARCSVRAPEKNVAPELESICVKATAPTPEGRFATAREMHDAIERFLAGDRDLEKRQELAARHAEAAHLASQRAASDAPGAREAREEAIREVNRALALDPTHLGAVRTMVGLVLEAPREVPPEAEAEMAEAFESTRRATARTGAVAYLSWFAALPCLAWLGITHLGALSTLGALVLASAAFAFAIGRTGRSGSLAAALLLTLSSVAVGGESMLFGPFVLVPGMAAANTLVFAMSAYKEWERWHAIASGMLAFLVPLALELAGVLPPSMELREGALVILPRVTGFPPTATLLYLVFANCVMVVVPSLLVSRVRAAALSAERRVVLQAHHLRQFLPDPARAAVGRSA